MTNKLLYKQNFSPTVAVSIALVMMPIIITILTMVMLVTDLDENNYATLAFGEIIDFGFVGCFCYQMMSLRKYLKNYDSSVFLDKITLAIPCLFIVQSVLYMVFNFSLLPYINKISDLPVNLHFSANDAVSLTSNVSLVTIALLAQIVSIVAWTLMGVVGVRIYLLHSKDFIGGLYALGIVSILTSVVNVAYTILHTTDFTKGLKYGSIVIINLFMLYVFSKARRHSRWFGFRKE